MNTSRAHLAPVSCAAASPDGTVYASGSYDRRVLLWDAESGEILRELRGHGTLVNGLDWSPDGLYVATASSDRTVRIWHAVTGRELACLRGHLDDVNDVRWSPDGSRLATASFDGTVRVWTRNGHCNLVAAHHRSDVNGVSWFPDGNRLAAASDDQTVSIFDAEDGRPRRILTGHTDWVDQVAVHPDGLVVASAGLDNTVRIWDAHRGTELRRLDAASCVVKAVAWAPDGRTLGASSYDGVVRLYENGSFRLLREYRAEGLWNRTLRMTPRGLLTGSFGGGPVLLENNGARRFGPETTPGLNGLAVSPDGERAVICSDDGNLYEVSLRAGAVTRTVGSHRAAVLCAAFSPDGRWIATGSWDRTVRIWDLCSGRCIAEWAGLGDPVNTVAFGPEGNCLWIGTFNGQVLAWDLSDDAAQLQGRHDGSVKSIACRGKEAFSSGRDGTLRRWSPEGERIVRTGGSILNGVAVDAKAERIATVSRRCGVEVWSRDGERLAANTQHPCSAKAVAWSARGDQVAAAYYDGHLSLWDPARNTVRLERVADASLSQVAYGSGELLISTWDAHGTLIRLDPSTDTREEIRVCA